MLRAVRPDVVYLNVDLSLAFWLGLMLRAAAAPPIVVHSHNSAFESPRGSFAQAAYRLGVRRCAARRIALSPEAARAMFGSEEEVAMLHCLIDFTALHAEVDAMAFRVPRRRFTFVCVGRLAAQKNQTLAIEALARLVANGLDADLILVGDGADRGRLEALAFRLGVRDRVHITGELESAAPVYGHTADAVLVTSRYEGQSRVVAEAQSFGLPVLASVGVPDSAWIVHGPRDRRQLPLDPGVWAREMAAVMAEGPRPTRMETSALDALDHGIVGGARRLADLLDETIATSRVGAGGGLGMGPPRGRVDLQGGG
jgi:glycosyltransferase involved in cell wall biosynthesis